jgi:hypothetical protein
MRPDPENRKAPPAASDQFKPRWKINPKRDDRPPDY